MKFIKKYNFFIYSLNTFFIIEIIIYQANNSIIEKFRIGLKEVTYAYYMRGKNNQYNGEKCE